MSDQQEVERDAIVLPEFESRIEAAKSRSASDEEMQSLSDEYQQARQDRYSELQKEENQQEADTSDNRTIPDDDFDNMSRTDLEAAADDADINWREGGSNADGTMSVGELRNALRNNQTTTGDDTAAPTQTTP